MSLNLSSQFYERKTKRLSKIASSVGISSNFRRELKIIWCWLVGCPLVSAEWSLIWKMEED